MNLIVKLVTVILTFIGRRIFLQVFSIEYMGITGLFGGILVMLSLADLGIETAMTFSYYKPLAEGDNVKLAALTHFYRRAYNIIAVAVAVLGLCVLPFLRFIVNTDQEIPHLEIYYLITLANSVISYLFVYKSAVIMADQRGYLLRQFSIWISVVRLVLQIIALYATRNYMVYCSVTILATLLNNLLITYVAGREYPQIKQKAQLSRDERQSIFRQIRSVFVYRVSVVAIDSTSSILISVLVSTAVVGLYGNYGVVVSNINFISGLLFSSLTPSIGNLLVKESSEQRHRVFMVMQTISYWVAGVFTFCLYFLMDDFIVLWIGPQYVFDELTKIVILLAFYLGVTQQPINAFRDASGLYERTKYVMLITAAINLVLSVLLGLWLGVAGILLAPIIARVSTHVWYEPIQLYKNFFGVKSRGFFIGQLANFTLTMACVALLRFVLPTFETAGWLQWILKGGLSVAIIGGIYLLRFYRTAEFSDIMARLKHVLHFNRFAGRRR